jgi:hypothetical protein
MLSAYANQLISWKHKTAVSKYNEPTYATSTIKGRRVNSFKLIRNATGEQVVSSSQVLTASTVVVDDLLDNLVVIAVTDATDLDGTILFKEVFLQ